MKSHIRRLWAPWRIEYILGKKEKRCFLCINGTSSSIRSRYVLAQTQYSAVMLNKYPYTVGHLLVIPKRHVPELDSLTIEEMTDFFFLLRDTIAVVRKAFRPDGLNIGLNLGKAAGAGLQDHLHLHIVPRWNGDHNFMPVISGTMVISEYLDATYDRIAPFFKKLGGKR